MLSNYAWKSPEMSFMTGLEIWKRKKVKTNGQSEENPCVDTHQHSGLKSIENCYYLKAARLPYEILMNFFFLVFFFQTAIGLLVAIRNSQSTHQPDKSSPVLSSIERRGRTTLWWWWRATAASPGRSPVPPACLSPSPM